MTSSSRYRTLIPALTLTLGFAVSAPRLLSQAPAPAVVSGGITSAQGQPLIGANVLIAEEGISVIANAAGRYTLTLSPERVRGQTVIVRARAIGFKPNEKQVTVTAGAQTVDFTLAADVNRLEEMVITGVTGATAQKNLPFTVANVSPSDLQIPAADPLTQLAGKVPGAQVTSFSGRPGGQPDVLLRGPTSLNATGRGQNPLFIVDGVVVNGSLPDLNSQDIETIEIVKGAGAATLYGSRAGNGVIQITTKRGRGGADGTRFHIRTEYGQGAIPGGFPLSTRNFLMMDETGTRFCVRVVGNLDCARTVDINEEALRVNEQATGSQSLVPQNFVQDFGIVSSAAPKVLARGLFQITPWPHQYDAMAAAKTNGAYASQNVDMTGRSGDISYFASVSTFAENAPFVSLDGFGRQSVRLNVDNQASRTWTVGFTTFYGKSKSGAANQDDGAGFRNLLRVPAGIDLTQRDKFGRLLVRSNPLGYGSTFSNPLYEFDADRQTNEGDRFIGNVSARYTAEWLAVEGTVGYDKLGTGFLLLRDQDYRTSSPTGTPPNGRIRRYNESQQANNGGLSLTASPSLRTGLESRFTARLVQENQRIATSDQSGTNLVVTDLTNTQTAKDSIAVSSSDQSVSAIGVLTGANLIFRDRYILDVLFRRDGSSLFGANERWANYGRASVAWRLTQEPWWLVPAVTELKLRASLGTAGGRPKFDAQYESYSIASGGTLSANTLGNKDLKPEVTTEKEFGLDAEVFGRIGINVNYAHAVTRDQIQLAPAIVATGFSSEWQNAGTLDNRSWEASLNVPIITRQNFTWSTRLNYDRNRPVITSLGLAPYAVCPGNLPRGCAPGTLAMFLMRDGERIGTIYGGKFLTACGELPAEFASQCGPGNEWQRNDEGLIVWIGKGNTPAEGITRNLWQAERYGCVDPRTGARLDAIGTVACKSVGGTVNAPNGVPNTWGNPILLRDSTGTAVSAPIGSTLPDYHVSMAQTITFRRLSAYGLLDASVGNDVFNEGRHFSLGEFQTREQDQNGKTVETAKPIGHYWRGGSPENNLGNYGFYNILTPNSWTVEDASYAKLREVSLAFNVGAVRGIGDWTVSIVGRNLYTFTHYSGFDPEVGRAGGNLGSGVINGIDAWQYPNIRTLTLSLASRF